MANTYQISKNFPHSTLTQVIETLQKTIILALCFFLPISTSITSVLLGLLLITWIIAPQHSSRWRHFLEEPLAKYVVLFYLFLSLTAFLSDAPRHDVLRIFEKNIKFLFVPIVASMAYDRIFRLQALAAFLSAMGLTVVLGLIKLANLYTFWRPGTAFLIFKDRIYTSFFLALAGFILLHLSLSAQRKWHRQACVLASLGIIYIIYCSNQGRAGQVIFLSLITLFGVQRFRSKGLGFGLLALLIGLGVSLQQHSNLHALYHKAWQEWQTYVPGQTAQSSIGQRLDLYWGNLQLIKQKLVLGWGLGSYNTVYKPYAKQFNLYFIDNNPHNEYLNFLLQFGLLGLSLLLSFFILSYVYAQKLPAVERWLAQGILTTMLLGCCANSWILDFTTGYSLVLMLGLCFGAYPKEQLSSMKLYSAS